MKIFYLLVMLSSFTLRGSFHHDPFGNYLQRHAVEVSGEDIISQIAYFLDDRFRKKAFYWNPGTLNTTVGSFEVRQMKFNTISNAIYIQQDNKVYRLNAATIASFNITIGSRNRYFEKGYAIPASSSISASFNLTTLEFYQYLNGYREIEMMEVVTTSSQYEKNLGTATIAFKNATSSQMNSLQQYLVEHENIWNVRVEVPAQEVNDNTFLEVLTKHNGTYILKHNYKKISEQESVSLVKHQQTHVFDNNTYYFSNERKELFEFYFSRKSIRKGLEFIGYQLEKVPSINNETKLIQWFNNLP